MIPFMAGSDVYCCLQFKVSAERVHELFRNISREDAEALGFNWEQSRPDWMVLHGYLCGRIRRTHVEMVLAV